MKRNTRRRTDLISDFLFRRSVNKECWETYKELVKKLKTL